jgi:hypothetical protein
MRFWVRVPVLSDPMTVVLPNVSTAGSLRMMALRAAMRRTPSARVIVNTTGSPSGIAATDSATAVRNISLAVEPKAIPETKVTTAPTPTAIPMMRANSDIRRWSGVGSSRSPRMSPAMFPSSVSAPIATTAPRPRPVVTTAPVNAIERRSASGASSLTGSLRLLTGRDSPVSSDSSICNPLVWRRRRSAGTLLPGSSRTMSPGTSSRLSISRSWPSRITRARGTTSCIRARTAPSACRSWVTPMSAFRIRTAAITTASRYSPRSTVTAAAPSRM